MEYPYIERGAGKQNWTSHLLVASFFGSPSSKADLMASLRTEW